MNDLAIQENKPTVLEAEPDLPQIMRQRLTSVVGKDFEDIVTAQADLAKGLWVREYVKDKLGNMITDEYGKPKVRVYQQKPDKDSGQYLLNQVIGKPKENMVVDGKVNFIFDVAKIRGE